MSKKFISHSNLEQPLLRFIKHLANTMSCIVLKKIISIIDQNFFPNICVFACNHFIMFHKMHHFQRLRPSQSHPSFLYHMWPLSSWGLTERKRNRSSTTTILIGNVLIETKTRTECTSGTFNTYEFVLIYSNLSVEILCSNS